MAALPPLRPPPLRRLRFRHRFLLPVRRFCCELRTSSQLPGTPLKKKKVKYQFQFQWIPSSKNFLLLIFFNYFWQNLSKSLFECFYFFELAVKTVKISKTSNSRISYLLAPPLEICPCSLAPACCCPAFSALIPAPKRLCGKGTTFWYIGGWGGTDMWQDYFRGCPLPHLSAIKNRCFLDGSAQYGGGDAIYVTERLRNGQEAWVSWFFQTNGFPTNN